MKENQDIKDLVIWQIAREYAGIAEAGGVKNVVTSLAESLSKSCRKITTFIPLYACSDILKVSDYKELDAETEVICNKEVYRVRFAKGYIDGVNLVFVINPLFEKKAVYTYTSSEEKENPLHVKGHGHEDATAINVVFQKSVLDYGIIFNEKPDVVQCQDAHTALVPIFAKDLKKYRSYYAETAFVVSIHNGGAGYHQDFPSIKEAKKMTDLSYFTLRKGLNGKRVEPFLLSASNSTLTTVSPWYAEELLDKDNTASDGLSYCFSKKKISVTGITNGIDFDKYDPSDKSKSHLPFEYDVLSNDLKGKFEMRKMMWNVLEKENKNIENTELEQYGYFLPLSDENVCFSYHGRVVHQKGLEFLSNVVRLLLKEVPFARFLVIGQGYKNLENIQIHLSKEFEGRFVYLKGYDKSYARMAVAASDFIVLPSIFEPCGLEDFIAQIYGTIPVAHGVGGLNKILDGITGFLYYDNNISKVAELLELLAYEKRANEKTLLNIIPTAANYVKEQYSWDVVTKEYYIPLYERICKK